ncbi:TetR/AcrR family transcriptional regulator [Phytoactinopolyspora halotolerans]|uniref:TetR/AcrR family transcriptional regulator n=1 Tax=Phytoactinopolyspora halotolerans TaxID=1981512 RepID=A0A6L9SA19_9ACTN|nr:TetR/AcrR family transcriptional regulator [Phytoactinopolyspora halotolerans]NEE01378.1 TetR/AcrR family transcriptional regulator [Phytoactinopolyspora halotolerans]
MSADQSPAQEPVRMLELLWGTATPPSRGPKPALSLAKIVDTAVAIADAEGLAAVSMRRVAEELGFTTMSLYRYVPSKEDLLELMQDAAAVPPPDVDLDSMPDHWRDAARWWATHNIEMFRRHPWFLDIPLSGPPMGPNQVRWMDRLLGALAGTGLAPGEKMGVLTLLSTWALSAGRLELSLTEGASRTGIEPDDWDPIYGELLAKVVDAEEFPALAEVIQSGIFSGPQSDHDDGGAVSSDADGHTDGGVGEDLGDDMTFGLEVILDGVEALVERRRTSP